MSIVAIRLGLRQHTPLYLLILLAAACGGVMEPLYDEGMSLWFYAPGQWTAFTAFGIPQPVWVYSGYVTLYGATAMLICHQIHQGMGQRGLYTVGIHRMAVFIGIRDYRHQWRRLRVLGATRLSLVRIPARDRRVGNRAGDLLRSRRGGIAAAYRQRMVLTGFIRPFPVHVLRGELRCRRPYDYRVASRRRVAAVHRGSVCTQYWLWIAVDSRGGPFAAGRKSSCGREFEGVSERGGIILETAVDRW
jgi:hypothetical protein